MPTTTAPRTRVVPVPASPVAVLPGCPCRCQGGSQSAGIWWPLRIPRRLWFGLQIVAAPFRALALVMEMALTACLLAFIGTLAAWGYRYITDDQVAAVLGQFGERILAILSKAGILPGGAG